MKNLGVILDISLNFSHCCIKLHCYIVAWLKWFTKADQGMFNNESMSYMYVWIYNHYFCCICCAFGLYVFYVVEC